MMRWQHMVWACACLSAGLLSCAETRSAFDKKTDWLQACSGNAGC